MAGQRKAREARRARTSRSTAAATPVDAERLRAGPHGRVRVRGRALARRLRNGRTVRKADVGAPCL